VLPQVLATEGGEGGRSRTGDRPGESIEVSNVSILVNASANSPLESLGERAPQPRFFFSSDISEISPETVFIGPLREKLIPFKKIRLHLDFKYNIKVK
jgi:hypothetical protein